MTLQLRSDQIQAMKAHAESIYPNECCGLLLGYLDRAGKVVTGVQATQNAWNAETAELVADSSVSQADHYWIAPEDLLAAMRQARSQNLEVIGIYHSHPDHPAHPSECDRRLAWPQYSYVIFSVSNGKVADFQSWLLDDKHQFQPEKIVINPIAAA